MNAERNVIKLNAIVVFDRDSRASELKRVVEDFQGDVIINGNLFLDTDLILTCNLHVMGCIDSYPNKFILLDGDLYCYGDIDCFDVSVKGTLCCDRIDSTDIKVAENLICKDAIIARGSDIIVAGDIECDSIETSNIYLLGTMNIATEITAFKVKIGY